MASGWGSEGLWFETLAGTSIQATFFEHLVFASPSSITSFFSLSFKASGLNFSIEA